MSDREAVNLSGLLSVISQAPSFARLRERIGGANVRLTVGVNDPTKVATVAALVHDQQSPVIVITPRPQGAEALAEELATWLGEQERILLFPERDDLPYERLAPDSDAVRDRLQAVAMAKTGARVIVASALALAQRTLSVGGAQNATQRLEAGQRLEMDAFLARLSAAGYVMEPLVQEAGQASRRGGIIDVFPPASQLPLRIELVGREVGSLRLFDPATQRSVRTVDEVTLGPARESVLSPGAGGGVLSNLDLSACSRGVRQRFEEELSYLREGVGFSGDSFYAPFLADGTLLEHLPPGALALVDEEGEISAAIEEAQGQTDATRLEMEARGEIPGGLPFPLEPWPRLRQALEEMPRLLRLSRWATREEPNAVRLPFVAAEAYAGQLRRLVTEVLRRERAGSRTVIVSQQAQRLAELLTDEGAPVSVVSDVSSEPPRLTLVQGSLSGRLAVQRGRSGDDADHRLGGVRLRQAATDAAPQGGEPRGVPGRDRQRRLRGAHRPRHRPLRRVGADDHRRPRAGVPGSALRGGRQAVPARGPGGQGKPLPGPARPGASPDPPGQQRLAASQATRPRGGPGPGRGSAGPILRPRGDRRSRLPAGHAVAGGAGGLFSPTWRPQTRRLPSPR